MGSGTKELLGDLATVGSGVLAWMYASTGKMDPPTTSLTQRFEDSFANTFGLGAAKAVWPTYNGMGNLTPKWSGWANSVTAGGAALLIVDRIAMQSKEYRDKLDGLHTIVEGAGWGILIGGIIGGIFDPDVTQVQAVAGSPQVTGSPLGQPYGGTPGNLPFGRAGQLGMGPQVV